MRVAQIVIFAATSILAAGSFGAIAKASDLSRIEGTWNNQGGDDIRITPDQLGGWDAFLGAVGQGNIALSTYKGSNIKVETKRIRCYFKATILAGGQQMNWQLRSSEGDCSSLVGYFTSVEPARPTKPAVLGYSLTICNKTDEKLQAVIIARRMSSPQVYIKDGWISVQAGECRPIGSFVPGSLYYYAQQKSGSWGHGGKRCVSASTMEEVERGDCGSQDREVEFTEKYVGQNDGGVYQLVLGSR